MLKSIGFNCIIWINVHSRWGPVAKSTNLHFRLEIPYVLQGSRPPLPFSAEDAVAWDIPPYTPTPIPPRTAWLDTYGGSRRSEPGDRLGAARGRQ